MAGQGLNTKTGRLLQIIHHGADPNLFNPNGKRVVCSNFEEYSYDEGPEFQGLKRQGAKAKIGNVLLEEMWAGTAKGPLYYNLIDDQILPFWLGTSFAETVANAVRKTEYRRPQFKRAERKFFAVQEGLLDDCELGCYGIITNFKWSSKRGNKGQSEFDLSFVTQAAVPFGAMTGGAAQNSKYRVAAANVAGDLVVSYLLPGAAQAKQVTFSIGDTAAQTKAKFESNGDGVNVNVAGTIATGAGQVDSFSGNGPAVSVNGVAVDFTKADSAAIRADFEMRYKASAINRANAVVVGTFNKPTSALYRVAGAGLAAANADYAVTATNQGTAPNGYTVGGFSGVWELRNAGDLLYTNSSNSSTIPTTGWVTYSGSPTAIAPAPTVTTISAVTASITNGTITYPASAGNVGAISIVGAGYTGNTTAPGAAGGNVDLEFTAPANARIQINKNSGHAGYTLTETQQGSDGNIYTAIVDPKPVVPGHILLYSAPTLAGALLPAAKVGKIVEWELNDGKIVQPQSHHVKVEDPARPNLPTTYDSHGEEESEEDSLQLMITMDCDVTGEVPALLAAGRKYVSEPRWWHLVATCPEAPYRIEVDFYGSLGTSVPRKFAGNIEQRMFPIDLIENHVEGFNFRVTTYRPA